MAKVTAAPWPMRLSCLALSLALLLLAAVAYAPALGAGFIGDDFQLFAQGKLVSSPVVYFVEDHSLSYFYRPLVMCLWWLAVQCFGESAKAQYGIQLLLHVLNALLIFRIAYLLLDRSNRSTALLLSAGFALLFVTHPIGIGTSSWLADRFDLMATLGVLGLLAQLLPAQTSQDQTSENQSGPQQTRVGTLLLAATLAAFSKEVSVAVLPGALLLAYLRSKPLSKLQVSAILLPFALMLLVRNHLLVTAKTTAGLENPVATLWLGSKFMLWQWPKATGIWILLMFFALGLVAIIAAYQAPRARAIQMQITPSPSLRARLLPYAIPLALVLIILSAMALQSPITARALGAADALQNASNYRFFYLAFATLLLLMAWALARLLQTYQRWAWVWATILVLAALLQVPHSRNIAEHWRTATAKVPVRQLRTVAVTEIRAYAEKLANEQNRAPCLVQLLNTQAVSEFFPGFADITIKSAMQRAEPAFNCLIFTEQAPWYQLIDQAPDNRYAPYYRQEFGSVLHTKSLDHMHYLFMRLDYPTLDIGHPMLRLRWDPANGKLIEVREAIAN